VLLLTPPTLQNGAVRYRVVDVFTDRPLSGNALARRLWEVDEDLTVRQGDEIGRPSRIRVRADPRDLRVGGGVVLAAEGELSI